MTFFNSKVKRFLAAMAGKDSIPDPESPIERLFEAICRRLDKFLLPTPGENDAGKIPVAKADGEYELTAPSEPEKDYIFITFTETTPPPGFSADFCAKADITVDEFVAAISAKKEIRFVVIGSKNVYFSASYATESVRDLSDSYSYYPVYTIVDGGGGDSIAVALGFIVSPLNNGDLLFAENLNPVPVDPEEPPPFDPEVPGVDNPLFP